MPLLAALLTAALALAPAIVPAASPTADPIDAHYRLANGLEIILRRDPRLPLIAVHLRYHVGAVDDPPQRRGLAHMVEHLMFAGSRHIDSDARHAARARALIHHDNGETDLHTSEYYTLAPRDGLATVLWLESDRMGFLRGATGSLALDRVRAIVAQERRQRRETDPRAARIELLFATLFPPEHPYHDTVIGPHAAIAAITRADIDAFLAAHYTPNNATLTLVGDLPPDTRAQIARYFADLPSPVPKAISPVPRDSSLPTPNAISPVPSASLVSPVPSATYSVPNAISPVPSASLVSPVPSATSSVPNAVQSPVPRDTPRLPPLPGGGLLEQRVTTGGPPSALCGWASPGLHADGDAALDVLFTALRAGAFRRLAGLDLPLVAAFDAEQFSQPALSVAVAELIGPPGSDPTDLLAAIDRVLTRVAAGELTEPELHRARLRLAHRLRLAPQDLLTRASMLSGYAAAFADPDHLEQDAAQWLAVTPAEVAAAARSLLTAPRRAAILATPP